MSVDEAASVTDLRSMCDGIDERWARLRFERTSIEPPLLFARSWTEERALAWMRLRWSVARNEGALFVGFGVVAAIAALVVLQVGVVFGLVLIAIGAQHLRRWRPSPADERLVAAEFPRMRSEVEALASSARRILRTDLGLSEIEELSEVLRHFAIDELGASERAFTRGQIKAPRAEPTAELDMHAARLIHGVIREAERRLG